MKKKIQIAILFGGQSAEHEISIQSAKNVISGLDKNRYEIKKIFVPKSGGLPAIPKNTDVVFPVLHGPMGEDGTVQGFLKLSKIPFVGADILGSAIGMDKDVQKRLLRDAKIKIPNFQVITNSKEKILVALPCFVKPATLGSSVGVSKVKSKKEIAPALKLAFGFENKVLVEEEISGSEIEVAVLGEKTPLASLPGEIKPKNEFYDYSAKYDFASGTEFDIPAKLSNEKIKEFQNLAIKVFKILCCQGMARVDFFLKPNGEIIVNEINTIPGFTNQSMYPKLWEASGLTLTKLLDKLISIALEK